MTNKKQKPALVETASGALRGVWSGDVAAFRGIPYAAPPVGEFRFMPPKAHRGWTAIRDASRFGAACPQLPGRMETVLLEGDDFPRNEDCLFLNVWTPELRQAKHPVLVWIHGGALRTGAGSLPWYSGQRMAQAGPMVVVTINYRLGPLGFLSLPGTGANLGMQDQIAALKWVRENIGAFGGDAGNVTIAGQSAGGASAVTLMVSPTARGLFRRVITESAPLGEPPASRGEAAWVTHAYLDALGVRPSSAHDLRALPVDRLLKAARELEKRENRFATTHMVLRHAIDGDTITDMPLEAIEDGVGSEIDLLIGCNHDEAAEWFQGDKRLAGASSEDVVERYRPLFGAGVETVYREYRAARPGATPGQLLMDMVGDELVRMPLLRLAEARDRRGHPAYVYQFDWAAPESKLGACHSIELPFVFDNFSDWQKAPMLRGVDASRVKPLARAVQQAWIAFARSGSPNNSQVPEWEPYTNTRRTTMRIDTVLEAVGDLAGAAKRRWWHARPGRTAEGSRAA